MKKLVYLVVCAFVTFACASKEGNNGPVIVNKDDILVGKKDVLDPDTQKQKLEQIANKFINLFPAKEYRDIIEVSAGFASHCDRYFNDYEYDWSELEGAGEDILDKLYSEKQKGEYKWEYTYTLFLSNCTGTVTLGKRSADYKSSKDTKLIVEDVQGEDWEFTLTSKNTKTVNLGEWMETWYGYEYDDNWNYVEVEYEELYKVSVEIPESLTFQVKRNGEFFGAVRAKFDYSISKEGWNQNKDRFGVSLEIEIDDLLFEVPKYNINTATGKGEWGISVSKGGMMLLSHSGSFSGDFVYQEEDGLVVDAKVNNLAMNLELNVLGELQIKGAFTDLVKISEMDPYFDDEKSAEKAARKVNDLFDFNVYYDCTSTVQAHLEAEPVYDSYSGKYYLETVIVFEDGSRYFFDKYFRERDFEDFIDNLEDLIFDYEDMVEDIYG